MAGRVEVAGVGNEFRRDDGAGIVVARRVAAIVGEGDTPSLGKGRSLTVVFAAEPLRLVDGSDADLVVVVDAIRSGAPPGTVTVTRLDELAVSPASSAQAALSTHAGRVWDVLRLARELGRAPAEVVVVGIEAAEVGHGTGLSDAVAKAVDGAVSAVLAVVEAEGKPCEARSWCRW